MNQQDLLWHRWQAGLDRVFSQPGTLIGRAREIATLLHGLVPEGLWAACRLENPDRPAVQFGGGADHSPWLDLLAQIDPNEKNPLDNPVADLRIFHAPVARSGQALGMLVLGLPAGLAVKTASRLARILPPAAHELALYIDLEAAEGKLQNWLREREEVADLTRAGLAAGGLVHDLANHLNSIVLQASCLQLKVDDSLKEELGLIRREGIQAAALLQPWQSISRRTSVGEACRSPGLEESQATPGGRGT